MTLKPRAIALLIVLCFAPALESKAENPLSLKSLSTTLKAYSDLKNFEAEFEQTKTLKVLKIQLKSSGRLRVERPQGVNWQITKPSPLNVILDEKKIVIESGVGATAQKQTFFVHDMQGQEGLASLSNLTSWLTLDATKLYQDYFVYEKSPNSYRFEPKASSFFRELEMHLDAKGFLTSLAIHEKSGDEIEIKFSSPKTVSATMKKKSR